jgi:hypothetical protein
VDGILGVVGPVRALVNPPLDEFNLLRRKRGHPFRHAGTFLVAADALDQQAVLGVAWDNHAPADAAFERLLAIAQAQPALTPFGSVAWEARGAENRQNLSREVHLALRRRGRFRRMPYQPTQREGQPDITQPQCC